jgi:GNAT superfamily N-acetyltransferase
MNRAVTTSYLEMLTPDSLRPSGSHDPKFRIEQASEPSPELNRFFYTAVGGNWYWTDRLTWSYQRWLDYIKRPELETWVGSYAGTPAGYFELEQQAEQAIELAYFGLLPQFVGRGIGGALLTAAIRRAWQLGPKRVWVHTCTLDGPSALKNYLSRGFTLYHQETYDMELPDVTPGPWPGAYS